MERLWNLLIQQSLQSLAEEGMMSPQGDCLTPANKNFRVGSRVFAITLAACRGHKDDCF